MILIAAERRCTICGWKIRPADRCFYFTSVENVDANRKVGWTAADQATEGVGHKVCMVYSAVACPWLSGDPDQRRRTAERYGREILADKGVKRGELVLAGAPDALLAVYASKQFTVVGGGGEPELVPFRRGEELRPLLEALIAEDVRTVDPDDLEFATLMAAFDEEVNLKMLSHQTQVELEAELGRTRPSWRRNETCPCGSSIKAKFCCLHRFDAAAARVRRGEIRRRRVVDLG